MPIRTDNRITIFIIFKLSIPLFFNKSSSSFLKKSNKNNCVDINSINGNVSKRVIGTFNSVNK